MLLRPDINFQHISIMNRVTYLDHSGFIVTDDNVIMVFDYYRDPG